MPTVAPSKSRRILIWTIAALVVIGVFYIAHRLTRTVLDVTAYTVVRGSLKSTLSTNGKVQPVTNYQEHAPFPGVVKALYVHAGEQVAKGTLLLTLQDADARTRAAQAAANLAGTEANQATVAGGGTAEQRYSFTGQLDQAQTTLTADQQSLQTLQQLQSKGAASSSEVQQAQDRLNADKASLQVLEQQQGARKHPESLAAATAQVQEARAAVAGAQQNLAQSAVRAPVSGTVYAVSAAATDFVDQGGLLLQMADLNHMQVIAYFDEPDVGKLHIGAPVIITWQAEPDKIWHGRIARLPSTIVTYTTRNVGEVLCSIDSPHDGLLPDTNVDVKVTTNSIPNALFVPRGALRFENGLNYVYRLREGSLKRTQVTIGSLNTTQAQILTGLKEGDVVALGSVNGRPLMNGAAAEISQ